MPAFIVKVTLPDGDLLPPISAMAENEEAAIQLVRDCGIAASDNKVETKGIRDNVMAAAFGEQPEGTATIRSNWIWDSDRPKAN